MEWLGLKGFGKYSEKYCVAVKYCSSHQKRKSFETKSKFSTVYNFISDESLYRIEFSLPIIFVADIYGLLT